MRYTFYIFNTFFDIPFWRAQSDTKRGSPTRDQGIGRSTQYSRIRKKEKN
jgi:hypothetical protein